MVRLLQSLGALAVVVGAAAAASQTCPVNVPTSCHNRTIVEDTCCFIPSGQLLLTQFWDARPATGPTQSWTIHGLWPDNCDGSYPATCDSKRAYTGIGNILSEAGATNTLAYMKKYWKDYKGHDERFWRHEWGKHGTCISTLSPSCYHRYQAKQEVVDFFQKTVELFRRLPTYQWLAEAGITPSNTKTYSLSQIQRVLTRRHGAEVTLNCKGKALKEVWYHYNVKGSLQTGRFIATQPDGTKGRCPPMVQYQPKTGGGVSPPGGGRGGRGGDGDGDGGRRGGGKKKKGKGRKGRGRGGRKGGEEEDDYEYYEGDDEADWEDVEESLEGEGEIALEEW